MSMKRRHFLKGTLGGGAVAVGASLFPQWAMAEWPEAAFKAATIDEVIGSLFGSAEAPVATAESAELSIKAPPIAENGAVVPVTISTGALPNVESVTILAEGNPVPLIASFNFDGSFAGEVGTRIKMGKTGNVVAVVKADGKVYKAAKEVKVTIGGCGG